MPTLHKCPWWPYGIELPRFGPLPGGSRAVLRVDTITMMVEESQCAPVDQAAGYAPHSQIPKVTRNSIPGFERLVSRSLKSRPGRRTALVGFYRTGYQAVKLRESRHLSSNGRGGYWRDCLGFSFARRALAE